MINRIVSLIILMACSLPLFCSSIKPSHDVIDYDFSATILPTRKPLAYIVNINKTKHHVNKKISLLSLTVELILKDRFGKDIPPVDKNGKTVYTTDVSSAFGLNLNSKISFCQSLKGIVYLKPYRLKPGVYTVRPSVRILETGKDAIRGGLYLDGGTVAIPAGNSIILKVK